MPYPELHETWQTNFSDVQGIDKQLNIDRPSISNTPFRTSYLRRQVKKRAYLLLLSSSLCALRSGLSGCHTDILLGRLSVRIWTIVCRCHWLIVPPILFLQSSMALWRCDLVFHAIWQYVETRITNINCRQHCSPVTVPMLDPAYKLLHHLHPQAAQAHPKPEAELQIESALSRQHF